MIKACEIFVPELQELHRYLARINSHPFLERDDGSEIPYRIPFQLCTFAFALHSSYPATSPCKIMLRKILNSGNEC